MKDFLGIVPKSDDYEKIEIFFKDAFRKLPADEKALTNWGIVLARIGTFDVAAG